MTKEEEMTLIVRKWPRDLQRELRAEAIMRGVTLRDILIEAGREWLRTKGKGG